ncbi:hypothetical protein [Aeromonas eucrenophila]|uniref:Uncharacterized protein n=1 Tax=Aeromonas eucrenophila TaxID=649 RepID=A0ABW0YIX9_9GAMM|nr:hypothetical protein [Aeromonas eucrenophila]
MLEKTASEANKILDKADDFKYFVLLGTFIMILDSSLIQANNISLLNMTWGDIELKITIGDILVFICFFSLYITFIITTIKFCILGIAMSLPTKILMFFNSTSVDRQPRRECIHVSRLKSMAIRENNSIAYDVVKEEQKEKDSNRQLERYCLAFLVASLVNYFAGSDKTESVLSVLFYISDINNPTFFESIKMVLGSLLYFGIFRIGVLIGCGFIYDTSDRDYIYLPKDNELS